MLKLTMVEFVFRGIPEAFMLMLGLFTISNIKLKLNKYLLSSILLIVSEYFVRILPISYGVHTILNIFIMIIVLSSVNKVDIVVAIKASLITTMLLYVLEGIDVLVWSIILKDKLEMVMSNSGLKVLCGIPSLLIFTLITTGYYLKKRDA